MRLFTLITFCQVQFTQGPAITQYSSQPDFLINKLTAATRQE